ncbi:MAG TPA: CAP domain-containing protein [Noviherbaspirillum sp.]
MERISRASIGVNTILASLLAALALAGCGGGSDGGGAAQSAATQSAASAGGPADAATQDPGAPQATGNTATDGFNWFNYRRAQVGIRTLARDARADTAAQGHSNYQKIHNIITHEQTRDTAGFTGVDVGARLAAAGYQFGRFYAYGEVISSTSDPSGFNAAEDLIAAIYHRFVIFDPIFRQIGVGAATVSGGPTYFTTNFVTEQLDGGLGAGKVVVYPFAGQQRVARNFFSDNEVPDPFPGRNEVGYPISVHADITSSIEVGSFTVRPRGGNPLAVRLLTRAGDAQTPQSAAAIIPLDALATSTTYDVQFSGAVDGTPVSHSWSFTTQ